jgi:MFS transporter, ACS family, hexuronate transporter
VVDTLGTRIGFAVIMTFWSLANASHALATGFAMLMVSRFLLGMGEGGGFPAATRAVAEWFPAKERATAMGIINTGTAVGAGIAPPLIALVLNYSGWRWIFVGTGGLGLPWTWWWISSYFSPANHPEPMVREQFASASEAQGSAPRPRWFDLLRIRESWGLVSASFSAMQPGTSIFFGSRNIFTMLADLM